MKSSGDAKNLKPLPKSISKSIVNSFKTSFFSFVIWYKSDNLIKSVFPNVSYDVFKFKNIQGSALKF